MMNSGAFYKMNEQAIRVKNPVFATWFSSSPVQVYWICRAPVARGLRLELSRKNLSWLRRWSLETSRPEPSFDAFVRNQRLRQEVTVFVQWPEGPLTSLSTQTPNRTEILGMLSARHLRKIDVSDLVFFVKISSKRRCAGIHLYIYRVARLSSIFDRFNACPQRRRHSLNPALECLIDRTPVLR